MSAQEGRRRIKFLMSLVNAIAAARGDPIPKSETIIFTDANCVPNSDLTKAGSPQGAIGSFREDVNWLRGDNCPSVPAPIKMMAYAFNTALCEDTAQFHKRHNYRDSTGPVRYEFTLQGLQITNLKDGSTRQLHPESLPPRAEHIGRGKEVAVTYTRKREGDWLEVPEFDLLAAGGARIFAKQKGKLRFFFTTIEDEFFHALPAQGERLPLNVAPTGVPSFYSALDPEYHRPIDDKVMDWSTLKDFNGHPTAAPFTAPKFNLVTAGKLIDRALASLIAGIVTGGVLTAILGFLISTIASGLGWLVFAPAFVIAGLIGIVGGILTLYILSSRQHLLDLIASLEGNSLLRAAKDLGVGPDLMLVKVIKDVWYEVDARPPYDGAPEAGHIEPFEMYDHVTYKFTGNRRKGRTHGQKSIKIHEVLDLGVGHVHRHTSYDESVGGEVDTLRPRIMKLYQAYFGPIEDGGGFVDGTCNFYMLAKIGVGSRKRGEYYDRYAVLWIDEQTYPSDRWHVISMEDSHWDLSKRFAVQGQLEGTPSPLAKFYYDFLDSLIGIKPHEPFDYKYWKYDRARWWCPFAASWYDGVNRVNNESRMVVAKQVIAITGTLRQKDSPTDRDEHVIYTINASYGTIDRSWRWRTLPPNVKRYWSLLQVDTDDYPDLVTLKEDIVLPRTIRLREDMTICMKGMRNMFGRVVTGYWVQKYLPADNIEVPSAPNLPRNRSAKKLTAPREGYRHQWNFVDRNAFDHGEGFLHHGVYDEVSSRTHFYNVTPLHSDNATIEDIFQSTSNRVWREVSRNLEFENYTQLTATSPFSPYNERLMFHLRSRGPFGFIATHADKRDDELSALKQQQSAVLEEVAPDKDQPARIHITFDKRTRTFSPPVVQMAKVLVRLPAGTAQGKVYVVFYSRMAGATRRDRAGVSDWWTDVIGMPTNRLIRTSRQYRQYSNAWLPPIQTTLPTDIKQELGEFQTYIAPRYTPWNPTKIYDGQDVPDALLWRLRFGHADFANFDPGNPLASYTSTTGFELYNTRQKQFQASRISQYLYLAELNIGQDIPLDLARLMVDDEKSFTHAVTLWFENVTGHVAKPEHVVFKRIA